MRRDIVVLTTWGAHVRRLGVWAVFNQHVIRTFALSALIIDRTHLSYHAHVPAALLNYEHVSSGLSCLTPDVVDLGLFKRNAS